MTKKRELIDDLIDALVWMRRQEVCLNRPLTLGNVTDEKKFEPLKKPDDVSAPVRR
jgi:hypothetical protein